MRRAFGCDRANAARSVGPSAARREALSPVPVTRSRLRTISCEGAVREIEPCVRWEGLLPASGRRSRPAPPKAFPYRSQRVSLISRMTVPEPIRKRSFLNASERSARSVPSSVAGSRQRMPSGWDVRAVARCHRRPGVPRSSGLDLQRFRLLVQPGQEPPDLRLVEARPEGPVRGPVVAATFSRPWGTTQGRPASSPAARRRGKGLSEPEALCRGGRRDELVVRVPSELDETESPGLPKQRSGSPSASTSHASGCCAEPPNGKPATTTWLRVKPGPSGKG